MVGLNREVPGRIRSAKGRTAGWPIKNAPTDCTSSEG